MNVNTTRATPDLDNEPRFDFSTPKPKPTRCTAILVEETGDVQCEVVLSSTVYGHTHRAMVDGRYVNW